MCTPDCGQNRRCDEAPPCRHHPSAIACNGTIASRATANPVLCRRPGSSPRAASTPRRIGTPTRESWVSAAPNRQPAAMPSHRPGRAVFPSAETRSNASSPAASRKRTSDVLSGRVVEYTNPGCSPSASAATTPPVTAPVASIAILDTSATVATPRPRCSTRCHHRFSPRTVCVAASHTAGPGADIMAASRFGVRRPPARR